ncbi:MAG: PTS sugar transporter subunit IIA [Halorhabdus sp.]
MLTEHTAVSSDTARGVVRELGQYAVKRGYASEGYVEAVLDRESDFPTGLSIPTEPFDLAIPHADPDHVHRDALVVGLPETPVRFHDMDDPRETVEAAVVILLLADDAEGYTTFLSNLANLFQNPAFGDAVEAREPERILELVEDECL